MEENKYVNLLSVENYLEIINWLENPEAQQPELADSFMTTIYYKYLNRTGNLTERRIRRQTLKIETFPSLKRLLENVENKIPQNTIKNNPTVETPKFAPIEENTANNITENTLFEDKEDKQQNNIKVSIIAKAIRHCARLHDIKIKDSHIQIILYVLYGYRLSQGYEDIFKEVPQMWTYGPVFASAFSSLKKPIEIEKEYEAWKSINKHDIKLGEYIINLVIELGERKVSEITRKHTSPGTPWHQCRVMHPDKWGTPMDEDVIKDYFIKNLNKNKNA